MTSSLHGPGPRGRLHAGGPRPTLPSPTVSPLAEPDALAWDPRGLQPSTVTTSFGAANAAAHAMNPRGAGVGFVDHARLHSQVIESPPASPERWHTRPTEQEVTSALRKLMSDADAGLLVEGHIAALQGLGIMVPFFTDMRILAARSFAKRNDRIVEEQRQAQEERIGQLVAQLESDALAQLHEALRRILTQDPRDA